MMIPPMIIVHKLVFAVFFVAVEAKFKFRSVD